MGEPSPVLRYTLLAITLWLATVALSLWASIRSEEAQSLALATNTARASFDKDQAYRRWASRHGGVYVPPDAHTPPNPYLSHVPKRDLTSTEGDALTLMNPAYMLRQMMEEFSDQYGIKGHITGLVTLNPNNAPDAWERGVLQQFQQGVPEVVELAEIDGQPYLRLMRPMLMEQSCMKCHGHLGIPVGAIRGGVSISVPMASYRQAEGEALKTLYWQYALFTLAGLVTILIVAWRSQRYLNERARSLKELTLNAQVFSNGLDGILITDANGVILRVNPMFTEITGYQPEEVIGKHPNVMKSQRHPPDFYRNLWHDLLTHGRWEGEIWNRRKNGEGFSVWENISTVRDEKGELLYMVGMFRDITEQKAHRERIHYLAHYDILTDLPNRTLLHDRLKHAMAMASRHERELALLFIDLDSFKLINDSMGHPAGDELLKIVAERLQRLVREADTVARLGGDEFVLLLEEPHDNGGVDQICQRILAALAEPVRLEGRDFAIGASIGVGYYPKDGSTPEELLKHADTAMYRAKELGKGRFCYFDPSLSARANQRFLLESQLRQALELRQLRLVYQPQVSLEDGRPCGVEALLRWRHPTLGSVPPCEFIPLAEESGLIHAIGRWVLQQACRDAVRWRNLGKPLRVSVNISGVQFTRGDLLQHVESALAQSGLAPEYLELEITEGVMLHDLSYTTSVLNQLCQRGITIALDDFGTGYSSLTYLKRLAVSRLKIDRSFVSEMDACDEVAISQLIIQLGRLLRLRVIAEGIETESQYRRLSEMGCDEGQGFLVAKPLELDDFETWLQAH